MVTGIGRKSKMNNTGDQIHDLHKGFGKVPKYLQKFKQNREEEMKQKEIEKQIQDQIKAERKTALSEIKKQMRTYRVTFADIEKSLAPGRGYEIKKVPLKSESKNISKAKPKSKKSKKSQMDLASDNLANMKFETA